MQNRCLFFACLFLFPVLATGQARHYFAPVFSIDYGYRYLSESGNMSDCGNSIPPDEIMESRNNRESWRWNYRAGVDFHFRLSDRWWLKTGLRAARMGYDGGTISGFTWPSEFETGEYVFDPTLPHSVHYTYDYWFLEIPITGRYVFSKGRWAPYAEMGVSPMIHLKSVHQANYDVGPDHKSTYQSCPPINLFAQAAVGVQYETGSGRQLFVQPTYRLQLNSLKDVQIEERLFAFGLEFGARIGF